MTPPDLLAESRGRARASFAAALHDAQLLRAAGLPDCTSGAARRLPDWREAERDLLAPPDPAVFGDLYERTAQRDLAPGARHLECGRCQVRWHGGERCWLCGGKGETW